MEIADGNQTVVVMKEDHLITVVVVKNKKNQNKKKMLSLFTDIQTHVHTGDSLERNVGVHRETPGKVWNCFY